jgi:prostaglandin-H2 D-isomerase / glutathione transferase
MAQLKVTYFDFAGSRGEEVRLALALAGVPFEDNRIDRATFASLKPDLPFGAVPVLEVDGRGRFGQSNAILRLIGRMYGLHPEDPFAAARHDALMDAAEDLRHRISPTLRMDDPAEKKAARQRLASDYIPLWGNCVDRQIGDAPFVGGTRPNVADVKLYVVERWISTGSLDDIPADSFDPYRRLKTVVANVASHPAVVGWYAAAR